MKPFEFKTILNNLAKTVPRSAPDFDDPDVIKVWFAELGHVSVQELTFFASKVVRTFSYFPSLADFCQQMPNKADLRALSESNPNASYQTTSKLLSKGSFIRGVEDLKEAFGEKFLPELKTKMLYNRVQYIGPDDWHNAVVQAIENERYAPTVGKLASYCSSAINRANARRKLEAIEFVKGTQQECPECLGTGLLTRYDENNNACAFRCKECKASEILKLSDTINTWPTADAHRFKQRDLKAEAEDMRVLMRPYFKPGTLQLGDPEANTPELKREAHKRLVRFLADKKGGYLKRHPQSTKEARDMSRLAKKRLNQMLFVGIDPSIEEIYAAEKPPEPPQAPQKGFEGGVTPTPRTGHSKGNSGVSTFAQNFLLEKSDSGDKA